MNYLLVRHKVADFSKWKPVYDAHLPARQAAGAKETVILFEVGDLQKAREFSASDDLRERMQEAGVIDKPDIYFLTT